MNELGKQIMAAIDRSLAPAPPKDRDATTLKAALSGKTYYEREFKKQVLDMDGKWNDYRLVLENSGYLPAKAAYLEHQKLQQQMLVEGNFTGDFFTLQDWVEEMAERGMAARRQMALLSQQAALLLKPICTDVARILTEQADEVQANDKAQCARFAIDYPGSPVAVRLRQLAASVLARVASGNGRPKSLAPFLFE